MNIQQLEYVVALDNHRHFISAAEACNVTQPTLTMQLKKLEDEVGIQLFDRTKKPLKPTPEGEAFILRVRKILNDLSALNKSVKEDVSGITGEFRIAIIPTLAPHLLPIFLNLFVADNPNTILRIEEMESEHIIKALHDNRLDLAIMATPTEEKDLKETILFNESFLFYAPENHFLLNSNEIVASDLNADDLLLLAQGHCFRSQALNLCNRSLNPKSQRFFYESGSIETLKGLVRKGVGFTLVPELSVNAIDLPHVKRFKSPEPVREVSIVSHVSFNRSLLIDRLKEAIRKSLPNHISKPKEFVKIKWR